MEPCKRFKPPTDKEENDVITKGYIPENTRKSTSWALKVFNKWRYSRESEERNCPDNLLESEELNYWLPRFINEVRRTDGNPYPPRSIHQLLAGLQRYMPLQYAIQHTQKVFIFGNSFLLVFVTHRLIYCLFSSITEVLFNDFVFQY